MFYLVVCDRLLDQGLALPCVQFDAEKIPFPENHFDVVTCDYAVRADLLQEILEALEVTPVRDAFADKENKRFDKWYGEGSPDGANAFEQNWGSEILWINPPFNLFPQVLDKIVQDKAHTVIIALLEEK